MMRKLSDRHLDASKNGLREESKISFLDMNSGIGLEFSENVAENIKNNKDNENLKKAKKPESQMFDFDKIFSYEKPPEPTIANTKNKISIVILYILFLYSIVNIFSNENQLQKTLTNIFETWPIDYQSRQYQNITSKWQMDNFITNVVLPQIYDESIKTDDPINENYHYLGYFNYFAGMRMTYNRIDLKDYIRDTDTNTTSKIRKRNYNGKTNKRYKDLQTEDYYEYLPVSYKSDGGYRGKGGYIYFFQSNWTNDAAQSYYIDMWQDGVIYSDNSLTFTLEIMFYNENLQTGVVLIYEFLINNAGVLEKHKNVETFYLTRYSSKYRSNSKFGDYMLITFDLLFFISIMHLTYK